MASKKNITEKSIPINKSVKSAVKKSVKKAKAKPRVTTKKKTVSKKKMSAKKSSLPRLSGTALRKKTGLRFAENYQIRIKVFGVGGGGGNAISRMQETINTRGVDMIAVNTDSQELDKCLVRYKIHVGKNLTRGQGTGMDPEFGRQAAEENRSEIVEAVKDVDLVFVTAGLGGGTGSGGAPIVARAAKESGALTVAIVTKPFTFEGPQRAQIAENALARLRESVDALIVVPNDRVFSVIKKDTLILKAFQRIDDILKDAIFGISDLISSTGINNVDFADVKTIMKDAGSALIGVGIASGKDRAVVAASDAINSPLLEFSIEGAQGILFGVSGGRDLKMGEINDIAKTITATTDPGAKIIFGTYHDRKIRKGAIKVTLIATGFNGAAPSAGASFDDLLSENSMGLFDVDDSPFDIVDSSPEPVEDLPDQPRLINESVFTKNSKREEDSKETPLDFSGNKKGKDIPRRGNKPRQDLKSPEPVKDKGDLWEIPAFLRRKKKKE